MNSDPISVPAMEAKVKTLLAYARRHPGKGLPTSKSALALALRVSGAPGAANLDGSRITRAASGERPFAEEIHIALLSVFGITWPCPSYYDPELGRDRDARAFERMLLLIEGAIVLIREQSNEAEFPLEDMFVLELRESQTGRAFCADLIAKLATFPIVGDEGQLQGLRIGEAGFSQFAVRTEVPTNAEVISERPKEWEGATHYSVRDRSAGSLRLFRVTSSAGDDRAPRYLDDNIPVCRLRVAEFAGEDRLIVIATAPLPELRLDLDNDVVDPDQKVRFQRIAQNQILEKYREGQGPIEVSKDVVRLGKIVLRRQTKA